LDSNKIVFLTLVILEKKISLIKENKIPIWHQILYKTYLQFCIEEKDEAAFYFNK
jgi:hypothetical protein